MGQVKKPQPTIWLDVTKPGEGLVVAWNSERYLLTQEQACRLANVILALLKRPDKADDGHVMMNETAERFFAATLINEPYDPAKIHVSHDLESVGNVGLCKICRQGWMGEVMTPGLSSPCTKVKPQIDPMTGHPVELKEHEGFGQGLQDAGPARQQTAWIDARPWIDVTDGEVPPHMLLEKTPPQNGHDIGKVFESILPPPTLMPGRGQPG